MRTNNYLLPICRNHGITLVELGKRVGKSKQYMSELGRGNIPLKYEMAVKIANELKSTPDKLFFNILFSEDGSPPPPAPIISIPVPSQTATR